MYFGGNPAQCAKPTQTNVSKTNTYSNNSSATIMQHPPHVHTSSQLQTAACLTEAVSVRLYMS